MGLLQWRSSLHASRRGLVLDCSPDLRSPVRPVILHRVLPSFCLFLFGLLAALKAAPGDLDPTFGNMGQVITSMSLGDADHVSAVAVQPDGKIVASGTSTGVSYSFISVARYTASGALDASFGSSGKVTEFTNRLHVAQLNCMVLQPDGKIVVAGRIGGISDDNPDFLVMRFTASGSLDSSFGAGGVTQTPINSTSLAVYGVALQGDGKIVVAGSASPNGTNDFAVARYTTNGTLDASFGTNGIVVTPMGSGSDIARGVIVQGDGKIVLAGRADGGQLTFGLTRYLSDGALDDTFGTGGKVISPVGDNYSIAYGIVAGSGGRLLVCGEADGKCVVAQYLPDGSLDPSFGAGGKSPAPPGNGNNVGHALARHSDGTIAVAGYDDEAGTRLAVARYAADGMFDASFGPGGWLVGAVGFSAPHAVTVAVQSDQKIVVGGRINFGGDYDFAAARFLGDGKTEAPLFTAPASGGAVRKPVTVAFDLPEAAQNGTLKLTFSGAQTRTLTLANSLGTKGPRSFTFDPAQPTASSAVASIAGGTSIPDGVYDGELSYQDIWANPTATASSSGVRIDTVAPAFSLPANITAEAANANGVVVTYSASASDSGGSGVASSSFLPATGGTFPIGTTTVNATATDNAGNTSTGSFTVKVQDTTPPVVTVPANLTVPATGANGASVSFTVSASDVVDGAVTATPDHASGSVFPLGTATVNVSASDSRNNARHASFTVTVTPSSDATLAELGVTNAGLKPPFASTTTDYAATVGYTVTEVTLNAAASFPGATVQQTPPNPVPLAEGTNEVQWLVTAQDGATTKTYTLAIQRTKRDVTKPAVTIAKPAVGSVTGPFTISGLVKESIGLASVTVQLNGGPRVPAVLASEVGSSIPWSVDGWMPENGSNTILVTATDYNGNVGTATRTVTYIDPDVAPLAGIYLALIRPAGVLDVNYVGLVTVQVSTTGAFTGKGVSSGLKGSFRGVLRSDGVARFKPSLTTGIHLFDEVTQTYLGVLELSVTADGLSGSLSTVAGDSTVPPTVLVTFAGAKAPYSKANPVSPSTAGSYHVVFDPPTPRGSLPAGSGYAVTNIGKTGGVSVAGSLADGTKLSVSTRLRADSTVPLFSPLYRKRGALIGTLLFAPSADADVTGDDFQWLRPDQPGEEVTVFGTRYSPPASLDFGQGSADPINGNARLVFSEGGLSSAINKPVSVDPGPIFPGQVKLIPPSARVAGYQLRLNSATGVFSGTFTNSDGTEIFRGVLLNRGAHRGGYGYFGAKGRGGRVFLDPAGP